MRNWLAGRKTYLTAAAAVLAVVIAWADGQITDLGALQSIGVALGFTFLRAGSKSDATAVQEGTRIK